MELNRDLMVKTLYLSDSEVRALHARLMEITAKRLKEANIFKKDN